MTTLFDITFEDQKFIPDIGNLGNYVRCSGGTIAVSASAALVGGYGMAVTPRTTTLGNYAGHAFLARYVEPQTRIRQRFYFDPNSISCSDTTNIVIAQAGSYARPIYQVVLYCSSSVYYLFTYCFKDDNTSLYSGTFSILDQPQYIEMDWKASSAPGANDGFLTIWVGGVEKKTTTAVDNDTFRVSTPRLGVTAGASTSYTISGTMYFDSWKANNDGSSIGA
jgi:hypothetical protein